jgi:hypothetical protein
MTDTECAERLTQMQEDARIAATADPDESNLAGWAEDADALTHALERLALLDDALAALRDWLAWSVARAPGPDIVPLSVLRERTRTALAGAVGA